jgi:hypothetical protein
MTLALTFACAVCARDNAPGAALLIAAMLAVPYTVAALVIGAIRRADAKAAAGDRQGGP